uniref:Pre-mRNA splicing Prp18-interacting factor n=1 Tax=Tanacetum cinerariifolium TaxID=118510 RepID=A0A6L2MV32_TANCI|nr:hypothetical protein [Tanacetum cinerariifolium]
MTSFGYRSNPRYAIKECSSCGTLYTRDCVCSIGTVEDKILVLKPPKNYARCTRCGYWVDGPHCQGCALLRQELEENLATHSLDFQYTSEPSNASTNVVNAPREPYVVKQDNGSFGMGKPVKDVLEQNVYGLSKGLCYICGHNQNSLNDSPRISKTSSQSPPNINHCCYECGDPLDGIFCKRCTCKSYGKDAYIGYNCPLTVPVISNPEPCNNQTIDELPQALPNFHPTFHSEAESPFTLDSTPTYVNESPNVFNPPPQPPVYPCEFYGNDAYSGHYCTPQTLFIYPEPCYKQDFNFPQNFQNVPQQYPCCDNCVVAHEPYQCQLVNHDCYHEQSFFYDFTSIGFDQWTSISTTKLNEFIKSCVENLVPNLSESEGENGCDVPAGFTTFSNVLFDDNYDSNSSDDQSLSVEDVREKIYANPLFDEEIIPMEIGQHSFNVESDLIGFMPNHDSSITISSKIDSLFNEFAGELTLLKSFSPGIDKTDCHPEKEIRFAKRLLYDNSSPRPLEEIVSDNSNAAIESFSPSPIPNKDSDPHMEEIDLYFNPDDPMPLGIDEEDDDDSERDIPILKELLDNYSLSLPTNESYHFDIPSPYRPPAKQPDGNTGTLNIKMLGDVSDQKVPIPNLTITRILNQEKSPDLLSHLGFEAFQPSAECSMIINGKNTPLLDVPLFHFYPLDHLNYRGIRPSSAT